MKFQKGMSGNPAGRPRELKDVQKAARHHTKEAIETLAHIMNDLGQKASVRISASSELLSRGWGKPSQSISVEQLQQVIPMINISLIGNNEATSTAITGQSVNRESLEINS